MRQNLRRRWAGLIWTAAVALALVSGCKKLAEHPGEHPEHPAPGDKKTSELSKEDLVKEYTAAIETYLGSRQKEGPLPIEDVGGKAVSVKGPLRLVRIHTDKIVRYKGDTYFACSDFEESDGKAYDLDFFMERTPSGWRMERLLLHKIDGKLQMTYRDNDPVPLGG